jgi:hypothetical protein
MHGRAPYASCRNDSFVTRIYRELERRQVRNQDEVDGAPDAGHNPTIRNPTLLA